MDKNEITPDNEYAYKSDRWDSLMQICDKGLNTASISDILSVISNVDAIKLTNKARGDRAESTWEQVIESIIARHPDKPVCIEVRSSGYGDEAKIVCSHRHLTDDDISTMDKILIRNGFARWISTSYELMYQYRPVVEGHVDDRQYVDRVLARA